MMKNSQAAIMALSLLMADAVLAQTPAEPPTTPAASAVPAATVTLRRDTPVELMAMTELTTAKAAAGTTFRLRVNKPVTAGGVVAVPVGTWAHGEVLSANDAGGLGKAGKMTARLTHLELGDTKVPLEGTVTASGTGSGSAAVAVVLVGITGLFHRGNNAKIKAGEIVTAFVGEDVTLDLTTTPARVVAPNVPSAAN